ncbi:MAG: dihydropteroate synthase [Phycisphaerae bacterium]|nr:dihydropteroate synthase [Phycisphaerae bacterium]
MSRDRLSCWPPQSPRSIELDPPVVMGILNTTPDSFHAGSRVLDPEAALAHALEMVDHGARIIDIGGESTRPGADRIEADEQIRRTQPVIKALRAVSDVLISIDTTSQVVAAAALEVGADIINDVSGGEEDPGLLHLAAESCAGLVLMHRTRPPDQDVYSHDHPAEPDFGSQGVVSAVRGSLESMLSRAMQAGVSHGQIVLDPGFGFGKSVVQNFELLRSLDSLDPRNLPPTPLLVGLSRKSFIGAVLGDRPVDERLAGSVAAGLMAAQGGASIIRTHDVLETVDALAILHGP